jgi:hypothetical protein
MTIARTCGHLLNEILARQAAPHPCPLALSDQAGRHQSRGEWMACLIPAGRSEAAPAGQGQDVSVAVNGLSETEADADARGCTHTGNNPNLT